MNTRVQGYETKKNNVSVSSENRPVQKQNATQGGNVRDMSNALMIMQKAQVIVQRALTASSRLQNMAMGTITSNPAEYEQIGQELRSVNASLEGFSVPVTALPAAREIASNEIPQMRENMQALTQVADNQARGNDQTQQLKQISGNFRNQADRIEALEDRIGTTYGARKASVSDVAGLISSNAQAAISAQGNIQAERVGNLI